LADAVIIEVARGAAISEPGLRGALRSSALGGARIDGRYPAHPSPAPDPKEPIMDDAAARAAAQLLLSSWQAGTRISALPQACRPNSRIDGYAVQSALQSLSGDTLLGWKIAATSPAGQTHIGVDGPLAGRLLGRRLRPGGSVLPLAGNHMRVAEPEFAFRMARDLLPRSQPYAQDEVLAAAGTLHPAIEVPDSRYDDFAQVGAAQLIADNACAHYFVLGEPAAVDWRTLDLVEHRVRAEVGGRYAREGKGANVLGDPRVALTWLANELRELGMGLRSGQVVTTGTCMIPLELQPGDRVRADFGTLGQAEARFEN
jgi:2-keto-4-pentenoate hydratase